MIGINPVQSTPSSSAALGRALQRGVTQSASVALEDVLELSGLARAASALGPAGLEALRGLAEGGRIDPSRLAGLLSGLREAGTPEAEIETVLGRLSRLTGSLGPRDFGDLFSGVESRGYDGGLGYLDALDNVFQLGRRDVFGLFNAGRDLDAEEFDTFLKSLGTLLQRGVVGTLLVEFRGQPTEVFLSVEPGSDYARAPLYPRRFPV